MANSKIYLGSTNIGNLYEGDSDVSIYLGEEKVYPLEEPLKYSATLSNGDTFTINCNDNPTLTSGETWQSTTRQTTTTAATVGKCVTTLGENVFRFFQNMISVDISSTVTSFSLSSFEGCRKLETINIPSGITSIPNRCFIQCYQLNNIEIPSGVTSIGSNAFQGCHALTSINIPSGVTRIDSSAFRSCSGLTSIEIPDSVTIIGASAFEDCSSLTSITCLSTTPPTLGVTVFDGSTCPILVPSESLTAYQTAWSQYADRIVEISTGYTYSVTITGLENGDTTNIHWNQGEHIEFGVGNGTYTYNSVNSPIDVNIESVQDYTIDYPNFQLDEYNPSKTVTFTQGGGGGYTYTVEITGLQNGDTTDIQWGGGSYIDSGVGNGIYTYSSQDDFMPVAVLNYSQDYQVSGVIILSPSNPSGTITFSKVGGLTHIPQGTDMSHYYNQTITRFKIGDSSFPSGYQQVNLAFQTGGSGQIGSNWANFHFDNTQVISIPCDVSGSDSLTQWTCFNSSWQSTTENPFTDLWIEFA